MNNDVIERLKDIEIEDFIWLIYIVIIVISWYSNELEKKYFLYNDLQSKNKYRKITEGIFLVLVVVYLYFLDSSIEDLRNLKDTDSDKKKNLVFLSFVGSLLIAISGFIFLYISFYDQNIDVEIAFN